MWLHHLTLCLLGLLLPFCVPVSHAADPFEGADPLWNLIHSPSIQKKIGVQKDSQHKLRSLLDYYDLEFFPFRNQSHENRNEDLKVIWDDMITRLQKELSVSQWRHLTQLREQVQSPEQKISETELCLRAPDFIDSGHWANTEQPLSLSTLTGQVVVIHFYAFGCINCVNNYPVYLDWQKRFAHHDVTIVGIHTPETKSERDIASVQQNAKESGFQFPILIDTDKKNWDAWGNSMWPSVYVVDKHGYVKHFWPGELRWEGATGDMYLREQIEQLLLE